MNDKDKNRIIEFVDKVTEYNSLISYTSKITNYILEVTTERFFDNREIVLKFKIINNIIHFYSSNDKYEEATQQMFFDEMMSQAQDELYGIK